ncbi:ABC transporter ATP-binding protein [Halofilum ochraceum]|uniref:ABC transporter ATP-binding protein n=1 Tax=Halofilum ochraceum TaxID=1611323 RepID=UPI0008DB31AE|nr:ABC transporter ATP-binding protein [Halofilum ochraceum]
MIRLEELTKTFQTDQGTVTAVDHVSLEVPEGEICVLLGPSGCGKTTTMKMINRLITPTSGKIYIDGKDTDEYDPVELRRNIGYAIQQIGLFPNMTVAENISVVPSLLGWDKKKCRERARELLNMVAMDPDAFMERYPNELSGGQQQRIGVIRALAADAPVLLMDEPFGAIDPINREVIQDEFLKMQEDIRKTIIFVSHDIDEAVKMGDRVAIFREGRLEQYSPPDELLAYPVNEFIADFVGGDRTLKRLRLARISDVMRSDVQTLKPGDPVERAQEILGSSGQEGVPVVDRDGHPRGYINQRIAEGESGKAGDLARPLSFTVRARDDLRTAVSSMFTHNVSWVAVLDDGGHLIGYVSQQDITDLLGTVRGDTRAA